MCSYSFTKRRLRLIIWSHTSWTRPLIILISVLRPYSLQNAYLSCMHSQQRFVNCVPHASCCLIYIYVYTIFYPRLNMPLSIPGYIYYHGYIVFSFISSLISFKPVMKNFDANCPYKIYYEFLHAELVKIRLLIWLTIGLKLSNEFSCPIPRLFL